MSDSGLRMATEFREAADVVQRQAQALAGVAIGRCGHCVSLAGRVLTFCAHARADLHQLRFFGGRRALCLKHPTRNE